MLIQIWFEELRPPRQSVSDCSPLIGGIRPTGDHVMTTPDLSGHRRCCVSMADGNDQGTLHQPADTCDVGAGGSNAHEKLSPGHLFLDIPLIFELL